MSKLADIEPGVARNGALVFLTGMAVSFAALVFQQAVLKAFRSR